MSDPTTTTDGPAVDGAHPAQDETTADEAAVTTRTWSGRAQAAAVVGAAFALIVVFLVLSGGGGGGGDDPGTGAPPGPGRATVVPSTTIATLTGDTIRFDDPAGEPTGVIEATWHGRPNALPIIAEEGDMVQVRLPERPNGSTAWIRRDDVSLAVTPFHVEIDVTDLRIRLYDAGELVLDAPAGVGTDDAPTPEGEYYVTFLQEPPADGDWGEFVMVTSAHSDTISDWQESGDAITAIHGPLGSDDDIGTTGAKVSHGCVRLHHEDLAVLRPVPAGAPVSIVA